VCVTGRRLVLAALLAPASVSGKEALPLSAVLKDGGKVVAASGEMVWVESSTGTYLCVVEMSPRFRTALRLRKIRDLLAAWPTSICFNAGSFE